MPTSDSENKDVVERWVRSIAPTTVVDIGAGEGTYSKLARREGESWCAVEAWAPYVDQYGLNELYDKVVIADARYLDFAKIGRVDLVIAGDVLEHMKKDEAKNLLREVRLYARHLIISIPLLHLDQGPFEGNWFETHIDHWNYIDMCDELADGLIESVEGPTLGYFLWRSK